MAKELKVIINKGIGGYFLVIPFGLGKACVVYFVLYT